MTASVEDSSQWREETIRVYGTDVIVIRGGAGRPLLVLHEELGHPGWLNWHAALARDRTLLIPLHPGWGRTPRADWITNVRDLAGFYSMFVREQGLAPVDVIGFSLGGWVAAEMAACNPAQFRKMVLVAPAGVRPPDGEIMDVFVMMAPQQLVSTVLDPNNTPEFGNLYGGGQSPEQFEAFEEARAETARLAWMPYMHNPSLPHLLRGIANLPTLLVWGRQDAVVPLSAGEAYERSIAGAKLVAFDRCGHRPEIEKPAEFLKEVQGFLE